jgi:hypothetical protein
VTGPDPDLEHGLGRGGEPLHAWVDSDHEVDKEVLREIAEAPGAVVMGRRLFDVVDGPHGVLGSGTPLLVDCHRRQLVQRDVRISPTATHLTYALHI